MRTNERPGAGHMHVVMKADRAFAGSGRSYMRCRNTTGKGSPMRGSFRRLTCLIFMIMIASLLPGCSPGAGGNRAASSFQPLQVSFSPKPSAGSKAGEAVTLSVSVSQNGQPVEDAQDVTFEIWKNGQEAHEWIKANKSGGGVYAVTHTFPQPGTYVIMYHVTAHDQHSMQKREWNVQAP
jgi:hypothetical protein